MATPPRSFPFGGTQVPSSMTQLRPPIIRAPLWGGAAPFTQGFVQSSPSLHDVKLIPYKMKGPRPMVPQRPPSADMAQLTSGLCSTFGFLCCLFFLPASWEAGKMPREGKGSPGYGGGAEIMKVLFFIVMGLDDQSQK